jgi:hypothetical protein
VVLGASLGGIIFRKSMMAIDQAVDEIGGREVACMHVW